MSENKLTKETEIRLMNFFNDSVEPKSMAKVIRQVNYLVAISIMREYEALQYKIIKLEDGFFWLNELAEALDPYLNEE